MELLVQTGLQVRPGLTKAQIEAGVEMLDLKSVLDNNLLLSKDVMMELYRRWEPTYLKRSEDMVTSMPFEARLIFQPKHGDILLKFDEEGFGYRNDGVWFWHEKFGAVECDSHSDDYGSVPPYFAFPIYPIDYFRSSMLHNNIVQVELDRAVFKKEQNSNNLTFYLLDEPETIFEVEPWDDEDVTEALIKGSFETTVVAFDVLSVVDGLVKCNCYYPDQ